MSRIDEIRVQELVIAYGADAERWPEVERQVGQAWLADNPDRARKLLAEAEALEHMLDIADHLVSDTSLLQARILKAAQSTRQDEVAGILAANDSVPIASKLANWKSVAATLLLTTGIGFGIGQAAAADTSYASAEALLSISMQSDYDETDLYTDLSEGGQ